MVINNAEIIQTGPLETMTVEDYDQSMKTHFYGPLYVNEAVLPDMRRRREGRYQGDDRLPGADADRKSAECLV